MQEVTFDLQTITPLFMAGADQKRVKIPEQRQPFRGQEMPSSSDNSAWQIKAEVRVPSFRGIMRYWQRALVGGLTRTNEGRLKQVIEAETKIFGTTDRGSAVNIRVSAPSEEPIDFTEKISEQVNGQWQATGKGYLLWSMADSGRPKEDKATYKTSRGGYTGIQPRTEDKRKQTNYKPPRQYYGPGTSFSITISVRRQSEEGQKALQQVTAALWLLTQFGGIGSRSRRCAGSLTVTHVEGNTTMLPFTEATTAQVLQGMLKQGIQDARKLWDTQLAKVEDVSVDISPEESSFDILSLPRFCRIWILLQDNGQPWHSAEDVMYDIGAKLQTYRSRISSLRERATFGLPLIIRSLQDRELKKVLEEHRRASPLLLRVTKLQGEQYVGIAVLFKTRVPRIEGLPMPDYSLIEKWVAQNFPKALEVTL